MGSLLLVCDKTHSLHTPTASMYHWSVSKMSLLCFNIRTAVCMLTSSSSKMTWSTLDSYTQYLDLLLPCWKTRLIFQIAQAKHVEAPNSCKTLRRANECLDSYIQVHAVFPMYACIVQSRSITIACMQSIEVACIRMHACISKHAYYIAYNARFRSIHSQRPISTTFADPSPIRSKKMKNARFRVKTPDWARRRRRGPIEPDRSSWYLKLQ